MAEFEIRREVSPSPQVLWSALTDWTSYGRWMPLTRIETEEGAPRVGWTFTGVSGVAPVLLRDPMMLTQWQPPGPDGRAAFSLRKTGRVLAGWAHVEVEPAPGRPEGSVLTWRELVVPRPQVIGALVAPLLNPFNRLLYGHVIEGIVADAVAFSNAAGHIGPAG